jgi:hypothetical protein
MPKKITLSESQYEYIRENRLKKSGVAIAEDLGVGKGFIHRWLRNNGLTIPIELKKEFKRIKPGKYTICTPEQDELIKKLYLTVNVNQLAIYIGLGETVVTRRIRNLGLVIPKEIIEERKRSAQKKKGSVPANKGKKQTDYMTPEQIAKTAGTRFQKGQTPHNAIGFKNGHVSIRKHKNKKEYKFIRMGISKWVPLHKVEWEKVNGKMPAGHCLWFKDGNTMNVDLSNLELITRAENVRRNSGSLNLADGYVALMLAGRNNKELIPELKKNKPLIELKRQSIILNRTINSHECSTNTK